jgi:hypothetical protein
MAGDEDADGSMGKNAGRLDDPTMTSGGDDPGKLDGEAGRVAIKTTGFTLGPSYLSAKRCRTW